MKNKLSVVVARNYGFAPRGVDTSDKSLYDGERCQQQSAERILMMHLLWLGQPACNEVTLVGGKVANLSRLATDVATYVPAGFCLTTSAFRDLDSDGEPDLATLPPTIYKLLATAYETLVEQCGEPRVAVRSSAVEEDGQNLSFAGQYETYLNLSGVEAVAQAVLRCWASAHSARVAAYRRQRGESNHDIRLSVGDIRLAVLVQQLVVADQSAVVFSANPVSGERDEIVINATWGLGESLVGGTVTPDTYVVRKSDLTLIKRQIATKQRMTVLLANGTREVRVPRLMSKQPAISDAQAIEMAQLALRLETRMGWPVDIECAYRAEKLYLLQCRPITTLGVTGGE